MVGELPAQCLAAQRLPPGKRSMILALQAPAAGGLGRRVAQRLLGAAREQACQLETSELWVRAEPNLASALKREGACELFHESCHSWWRIHLGDGPVHLSSERLLLRQWMAGDRAAFLSLNQDPQVNRFLPGPLNAAQNDALVLRLQRQLKLLGFGYWAVQRPAEPARAESFIGMVGLAPLAIAEVSQRLPGPALEMAWRLAPHVWNQGLATEGARRVADYAMRELGVSELVAFTVSHNHASAAVMSKLGFVRDREGDFEHPKLPRDHPLCLHQLFRLSRQRWLKQLAVESVDWPPLSDPLPPSRRP